MANIGPKTTVSLSFLSGLFAALVPAAIWVASVIAKAAVFEARVETLEQTVLDVSAIRQDVAVMKAQIEFLVRIQGRPSDQRQPVR
jgi:hypothetical protein